MSTYRVEISPSNRAVCQATHCKKEGTKIPKGDLRQGVLVTIKEQQSWKWRHWGCVTPTVLHNWNQTAEGDMDMIDGYEELPDEAQERVKRALDQLHVDDEDWNGDLECNRYDDTKKAQGMFVKTPKKKAADDDDEGHASPSKKPIRKKRSAKQADVDEDEEKPAPKKSRGRPGKAQAVETDEQDEDAAPPKKGRKSKKAAANPAEDTNEGAAPAQKSRGRKAKSAAAATDEDGEEPAASASVKRGRGKKTAAKATHDGDDDDKPAKVSAAKKVTKPQQKSRGRPKKAASADED